MKNFLIVSELALGDSVLTIRTIAQPLKERGYRVAILCNNYNKNLYVNYDVIVEDWPISKRRFYSFLQFSSLSANKKNIYDDFIVLIPSGNFLEKIIGLIRFRHLIKYNRIITSNIKFGMRRKKNNYILGNFFKFKSDINIKSRDAYGAHIEYFFKVQKRLGNDIFLDDFEERLLLHMKTKNLSHVIIQVSSTHQKKFLPLYVVKFLLSVFKANNIEWSLISDKKGRDVNSKLLRTPQWFAAMSTYDNCLLILQDSYLMHLVSNRVGEIFMWIGEDASYDWTPKCATPISSLFSLYYKL
jgi:hypothetical protein